MLFKYLLCIIRSYELYYTKLGMLSKCLFLFCSWFTAGSRIRYFCYMVLQFYTCLITLVPLWVFACNFVATFPGVLRSLLLPQCL